jgi:hypothetical protein
LVVALTGWWFARNYFLYGDVSAQKGLRDNGYINAPPPTALWRPRELFHWLWVIKSYYWLPTQYYRDLFHAPYWLRAIVGVFSIAAVVGWLRCFRHGMTSILKSQTLLLLAVEYFTCFAIYTYTCVCITHFAPRTTFPTFVVYAIAVGFGLSFVGMYWHRLGHRLVGAALVIGLLMANAYCLYAVKRVPVLPFNLFASDSRR